MKFNCERCSFSTDSLAKYAGHRSGHSRRDHPKQKTFRFHEKKNHICLICDREFETGPALGGHVNFFHSSKRRRYRLESGELNFDQIFVFRNSKVQNVPLKEALLAKGVPNSCSECQIDSSWNGKPLTLQVDHINGINSDDRFENLRLLCPNCHSQTDTWCAKNKKNLFSRSSNGRATGF